MGTFESRAHPVRASFKQRTSTCTLLTTRMWHTTLVRSIFMAVWDSRHTWAHLKVHLLLHTDRDPRNPFKSLKFSKTRSTILKSILNMIVRRREDEVWATFQPQNHQKNTFLASISGYYFVEWATFRNLWSSKRCLQWRPAAASAAQVLIQSSSSSFQGCDRPRIGRRRQLLPFRCRSALINSHV